MKPKKYTVEEILKASEIGEVSMVDARHICSLLDEAKRFLISGFDCHKCAHSFMNPFDQYYCTKQDETDEEYDIDNNKDCGGKYFRLNKKQKS